MKSLHSIIIIILLATIPGLFIIICQTRSLSCPQKWISKIYYKKINCMCGQTVYYANKGKLDINLKKNKF